MTGVALDDRGTALARHTLEVRRGAEVEASTVTDEDGSFRLDGVRPGALVLALLGPDGGDVMERCLSRMECSAALAAEECSLNVTLPEDGLERMAIVVAGHGNHVVRLRLVDDIGRPFDRCRFSAQGLGAEEVLLSDPDGMICESVPLAQDVRVRLTFVESLHRSVEAAFSGGEPAPEVRYLPLEFQVWTTPVLQELGTLVMPRVAGFELRLIDATSGEAVSDAAVRLQCSGGGQPPTEVRRESAYDGTCVLWSERSSGQYTLDVTAPGYQRAHQVGVLVVGDGPQPLELILERMR